MKGLLLKISHPDFTLSIVGPIPMRGSYALSKLNDTKFETTQFPVLLNAMDEVNNLTFCKIESNIINLNKEIIVEYTSLDEGGLPLPLFFEQIDYNIFLSYNKGNDIDFWHENTNLTVNLSKFNENVVSGTINFFNNVGETTFEIKKNNKCILKLFCIVYSTKLDFFVQRKKMLLEVQKIHNSILYELFKPTKEKAKSSTAKIDGIEWLTLFFQTSDTLLNLVKRIENKAHSKLHSKIELKTVNKLKGGDKNFIKQTQKFGYDFVVNSNKIWTDKKVVTNDTAENRYIKFILVQMVRAGKKWLSFIEKSDAQRNESIILSEYFAKIKKNVYELERILNNKFWKPIKIDERVLSSRGNFGFHHEFTKTEQFARKLKRGLLFDKSGEERIYVLSMDQLYELWAYIKIAEIISIIKYGVTGTIKIRAGSNEFRTTILTGVSSKVDITDSISLQTNRLFTTQTKPYRIPLVSQKPDIILEIQDKKQLVLFDAKYKINVLISEDGKKYDVLSYKDLIQKSIVGKEILILPNDADINVIHRYKDAIYLNQVDSYNHVVIKGFILFPGYISEESLLKSKDIANKFGISFLPLSPGNQDEFWHTSGIFDFDRTTRMNDQIEDIRAVAESLLNIIN